MKRQLQKLLRSQNGAASIEGAFIFPILVFSIVAILATGNFLMNLNMAQRYVEKSARIARMMDEPTQSELETVLKENVSMPLVGQFEPEVKMFSEDGWNYANLSVSYSYYLELPFTKPLQFSRNSSTRIPIRNMPG